MWSEGWRERIWQASQTPWDIVIVGGGITGAGILGEAVRRGYRCLLVEAKDFGYGTSSRSSKLVHGGLRYMRNAMFHLTLESVRERDQLLQEAEGLVSPLRVYGACLHGDKTPAWVFGLGLTIYDVFSRRWKHQKLSAEALIKQLPALRDNPRLLRGYAYHDAQTDDARLVLRVLRDAISAGGSAIHYAPALSLMRHHNGSVAGVLVRDDAATGQQYEVRAKAVINAAGIWSDGLRGSLGKQPRMRGIRGSHLVFPRDKFPLQGAVTLFHPRDNRAVFAIPWEGVVLLGTTDEDHKEALDREPRISSSEAEYISELLTHSFPGLGLTLDDVISTYAGVRPVVDTGKANPSKESREHALWWEDGLLTMAGGKLTTFRRMAQQAMNKIAKHIPPPKRPTSQTIFRAASTHQPKIQDLASWTRLQGRYGPEAEGVFGTYPDGLTAIADTTNFWNELRWAAQHEGVIHLEDLMLRRLRLGITLPDGGKSLLPQIKQEVQGILGWSDLKWQQESDAYLLTHQTCYQMPGAH